jgi:hypothetical protein
MRRNVEKISKRDWYARGGLSNPRLFRKANARGVWAYYIRHD